MHQFMCVNFYRRNTFFHKTSIAGEIMILVVNIGNTNIRFGTFKDEICIKSWTLHTTVNYTELEIKNFITTMYENNKVDVQAIQKIIVGSVVPTLTPIIFEVLRIKHNIKPIIVNRNTPSGVQHSANQMGTDIYANAVAAHHLYKGNKIVVDFGTALTMLAVTESGLILGAVIAPGIITSLSTLIQKTAQLGEIEFKAPSTVLGKDTETCMQSGMVYGYLSMIEGMIARINMEINQECFVISTGGLGHIYAPLTDKIHVDDKMHTLKGLYILGSDVNS